MIPAYHRPASVDEALQLKTTLGPGAAYLAGGTEVNNLYRPRATALIDLAALQLNQVEITPSHIRLGAGVTFQQILEHPRIPQFVKTAAAQMANRNIRNCATIGGNLATNKSCGNLIPMLVAAEAQAVLADRELPVERLLDGDSGLILAVIVPLSQRSFGLEQHTRTANDISIVTAGVSLMVNDGNIQHPILAIGGVAAHVVRLTQVEQQLAGQPLPTVDQLETMIAGAVHPIGDHRGSSAFKRQLAAVLGARALGSAATAAVKPIQEAD